MLELNGLMKVVYEASEWFLKMSIVNFLWFAMSLPLLAAFLAIDISQPAGAVLFGASVLLFMPLLFFPAASAVFASVRDWLLETDTVSSALLFWGHLKTSYKDSVKMGGGFAAIWLIWYFGYFYLRSGSGAIELFFLITGLSLFAYTVNFLSISAHYRMSGKERLMNAFFVTSGRPLLSLFILGSNGLLIWVSATKLILLLPLLTGTLGAFLSFSAFYRFTLRVKHKQEAGASS